MKRHIEIGFTRDFLNDKKKLILPDSSLKLLQQIPNTEYQVISESAPEMTPELIQRFDMVISRTRCRWTQRSFIRNNQLLAILRNGVGYDRVDVPALTEASVMLCITPDAVRRSVATAIITFLLALSTRIILKQQLTKAGRWNEVVQQYGYGLTGKTLGSIGIGNIGHEMFRLAKPFGMKHIAYDPYVKPEAVVDVDVELVDFDTLLAESDFISISCPLNEKTHHLIGESELGKMKKTAFLINTARGAIVDEKALIKALSERRVQGAAIDVFEQEPTPSDNPLLKLDNAIVTAHAMAFTDEFQTKMWEQIHKQVSQIIQGEIPDGLVNLEVWSKPEYKVKMRRFLQSTRG